MTNPKIKKVVANIARIKATIANYQDKLKELEKQKIQLENDEIVALFRREKLNEDEFASLLQSGRGNCKTTAGTDGREESDSDIS